MLRVVRVFLLVYLIYAVIMYVRQESTLFPAFSSNHHQIRALPPKGARLVELPASFGKVRAIYWAASGQAEAVPAVIYMHGNFEEVENSFEMIQPLVRTGVAVLQLEFPGFGGADGEPTYANLSEASVVAYDWLAGQIHIDSQRIVAMGYSVGGGVAAELTRLRPLNALILLSTFSSLEEMAHRYLLPAFLLRYPYDNYARVREFNGPVLIEHGTADAVIPFAMGQRLAAASKHVDFVALDCRHDDCDFQQALFAERLPRWLTEKGLLNRHEKDSHASTAE